MSRALEGNVEAMLATGNPQAAYEAIVDSLVSLSTSPAGRAEFEILPYTHVLPKGQYVLRDKLSLGISKLGLVQAFLFARPILMGHLDGTAPRSDEEIDAATAVMLLLDAEHLTAANTRKRLIARKIKAATAEVEDDIAGDVDGIWARVAVDLAKEKLFVDSLLTSRLYRHNKSPTLLNHRRWLLNEIIQKQFNIDFNLRRQLQDVVFVAAERHPQNYYAWHHARIQANILLGRPQAGLEPSYDGPGSIRTSAEAQEILKLVVDWCISHHTDTSGWSFLYWAFIRLTGLTSNDINATHGRILQLAKSLRLTNEAVWVFLRTVTASWLVSSERRRDFANVLHYLYEKEGDRYPAGKVLQSAKSWFREFEDDDNA
ncbi:hypothetical protein B0T22DRAFT_443651 [Podospora appendiculata]|uniref:Protein prenyltransferase n=1 Tax=Podospora appendiculata TaxID=314037 RepID=A0AAE0X2R4_9PEZI|nr:hypothetical protein B0T22DRAFT_443651 [Podospora appendiculata]